VFSQQAIGSAFPKSVEPLLSDTSALLLRSLYPNLLHLPQTFHRQTFNMFSWLIRACCFLLGHFSSEDMSSETMSPTYPGRPIKPLPKRRLRERLSPEAVETIKYPPAPSTTTPLFYYPYSTGGEEDLRGGVYPVDRQKSEEIERNYISRRNGGEVDSEDEYHESPYRGRYSRHSPDISGRSYRYVQKPEPKYSKPEPPASTTSSADGYDSFENTNNKKKRKIPTPGDAGLNGIHLSNELASLGISSSIDETLSQADPLVNIPKYHSPGGSSGISGISGPGRGRYGRVRNGRSPLRTLSDGSGTWSNGRPGKPQQPQFTPSKYTSNKRILL
jgi:hypothetical protein